MLLSVSYSGYYCIY